MASPNRGTNPTEVTNPTEEIVGYRFHPTDEELIENYLDCKNDGQDSLVENAINEVKICDHDPWELPGEAKIKSERDHQWHFFTKPDLKFPEKSPTDSAFGNRKQATVRKTKSGRWKSSGNSVIKKKGKIIGNKSTLLFHKEGHETGQKSSWVIHEYHSNNVTPTATPFVLCKLMFKGGDDELSSTVLGQTSNSSHASSSEIPSQANYESYQPAAHLFDSEKVDLENVDFEKFDLDLESWSHFEQMGCGPHNQIFENFLPYTPQRSITGEYVDNSYSDSDPKTIHREGFEELPSSFNTMAGLGHDEIQETCSDQSATIVQLHGDTQNI